MILDDDLLVVHFLLKEREITFPKRTIKHLSKGNGDNRRNASEHLMNDHIRERCLETLYF